MKIVNNGNIKLAIQKNGRLTEKSIELLKHCGLEIENYNDRLVVSVNNFPMDILFVRDDDIPEYIQDDVADLGIVGENVVLEKKSKVEILEKLGFGKCKLMIASPENIKLNSIQDLNEKKIATSYPNILKEFLTKNKINSKIIKITGSVEITPALGVADVICDIVSTGNTLMLNKLKKSFEIFSSQAVLIKSKNNLQDENKLKIVDELLLRIKSVLTARNSRYIMMNAPKKSLERVVEIIPSLKSPTIVPLADESMVAVHAVIPTEHFWKIVNKLKNEGASGIILLPIENMIV